MSLKILISLNENISEKIETNNPTKIPIIPNKKQNKGKLNSPLYNI